MAENNSLSPPDPIAFLERLGGAQLVRDARANESLLRQATVRLATQTQPPGPWEAVGGVLGVVRTTRGLRLRGQHAWVDISWLAHDMLMVRVRRDGDFNGAQSYALLPSPPPPVAFTVREGSAAIVLTSESLVCRIGKAPYRLMLETHDGRSICMDERGPSLQANGGAQLHMALFPHESVYGLGARAQGLNLRGGHFALWNQPAGTADTEYATTSIPWTLGCHDQVYGLLWDNSNAGTVDVGQTDANVLRFEASAGELRYVLVADASVDRVLARVHMLTGEVPLTPLWALGVQHSTAQAATQDDVMRALSALRAADIPCDALHLPQRMFARPRLFAWDGDAFPAPAAMMQWLHQQGVQGVFPVTPGVRVAPGDALYEDGQAQRVFITLPDGSLLPSIAHAGVCVFPDFTMPDARTWWAGHAQQVLAQGVDGLWHSMDAPTVYTTRGTSTLPDMAVHALEGQGGTHARAHNVYGLLMARASFEAQRRATRDRRPFVVAQAGYAGVHRYAVTHVQPASAGWEAMPIALATVLNMSLSGVPMVCLRLAEDAPLADSEVWVRWTQLMSLMPICAVPPALTSDNLTTHSPAAAAVRAALSMRMRLLPTLYTVAAQVHSRGGMWVRPLLADDVRDARMRALDDTFLVGESVLVAPVMTPGTEERRVFLPPGQWYDLAGTTSFGGGRWHTVAAPLDVLPVFVREGTVLPMLQGGQTTRDAIRGPLTMRVYPGNGQSMWFCDAGDGDGPARWTTFTTRRDGARLQVTREDLGPFVPPQEADEAPAAWAVLGLDSAPRAAHADDVAVPVWYHDQHRMTFQARRFGQLEVLLGIGPQDPTVMRPRPGASGG